MATMLPIWGDLLSVLRNLLHGRCMSSPHVGDSGCTSGMLSGSVLHSRGRGCLSAPEFQGSSRNHCEQIPLWEWQQKCHACACKPYIT